MDTVVIAYASALRGIRAARRRDGSLLWEPLRAAEQRRVLDACRPNARAVDREELERLGFMGDAADGFDVVVADAARRRNAAGAVCHVCATDLPAGSILRVSPDLYCCSPALATLQFSRGHGLGETMALAMELMGGYTLPEKATLPIWEGRPWPTGTGRDEVQQAHYRCDAAMTPRQLGALVRRTASSTARTFGHAAKLALPGSASPMETVMAGMFAMPQRYGGLACGALSKAGMELNRRVDFTADAAVIAKMPYAICDAYLPACASALEYNGGDHAGELSRIHDENRNTALAAMGIEVLVINKLQMRDIQALESIARHLYSRAGKRYRQRANGYRTRQEELLNGLRRGIGLPSA